MQVLKVDENWFISIGTVPHPWHERRCVLPVPFKIWENV